MEQAFGSAKQEVERASVYFLDDYLISALSSRVFRQQGLMMSLKMESFVYRDQNDAEALLTLAERCQNVVLEDVLMEEAEEEDAAEGWAAMAKALPLCSAFGTIEVSRRVMLLAERGDLKTIWDALGSDIGHIWWGFWNVLGSEEYEDEEGVVRFQPNLGVSLELQKAGAEAEAGENEKRWGEVEKVLEMSDEQFLATVANPSQLWS